MSGIRDILVLDSLFDDLSVERATAAEHGWSITRWSGDDAALAGAEVVVHVRTKVDRQLMGRIPRLRVVGRFGTGLDSVDQIAAAERDVPVVGVRDYCVSELAGHTLGLAFSLERRIDAARDGRLGPNDSWQDIASRLPIVGRTRAVVVGLGSVGTTVARALLALGVTVKAVSARTELAQSLGLESLPLEAALRDAQMVFLHTALDARTRGMFNAHCFAAVPRGTLLINTARLGLLDESATAEALTSGTLAALGLDATLPPTSPLRPFVSDPRMLITPHIGWYSERSATELRLRTIINTIVAAEAATAASKPLRDKS